MEPLIRITNVPITIEMKSTSARIKRTSDRVDLNISRTEGGGLRIESEPIKLRIDTFEARNSVVPTTRRSIEQAAQRGMKAAYEATAKLGREGQMLMDAKLSGGKALDRIFAMSMEEPTGDFTLSRIPTVGPEISWSEPDLTIEYDMEKLNFDWRIQKGDFEFIPGSIEFSITQRPDVVIEYIGSPIYVPKSADPHFEAEA
ncbi:MAG: DUF6470 family protein [Peptostreptococcaceae bacterium]|nr:DUF6470 family protein [Peptostreptococcaceae bacterium]